MDLRRLAHFIAVVDHGGFTAAAKATFVSQPAVSLSIKELERELGAELFERIGHRVHLTSAGAALVGPARQALRDVETARSAVAAVVGLESGALALASLPTLAVDPLARFVGRFRQRHPGIRLDLAAPEDSEQLLDLVVSGTCELGLTESPPPSIAFEVDELMTQQFVVVRPPGTGGARRLDLHDLAGVELVVTPPGTSSRRLIEEAFADAGIVPSIGVETAQREAILPLVLAGAGAAIVPEPLAETAARLGAIVARPRPAIVRRVVLVHRPGVLAPAAEAFRHLATHASRGGPRRR